MRKPVKRCETCAHWDENGRCALTHSQNMKPVYSTSRAVASDWEGYEAILETSWDFGCVQHEKKP